MVEAPLTVELRGPQWRARLVIQPPQNRAAREAAFEVPSLGATHTPRRTISASVRYTEGVNQLADGWRDWHVKIYRCATVGDTDALRAYLHRQAADIQRANVALVRRSRLAIDPPWAVAPVQIIRGDGQPESLDGGIRTELAAPVRRMVPQAGSILPSWFGDEDVTAERYLLAVSPWLDPVRWTEYRDWPGTEHLVDFQDMAAGLDTLHRLGTVHCDIKPANVCRYSTASASGYALIDTDAVTQVTPAPTSVRLSRPYDYVGLREWVENEGGQGFGIDSGVLRAQDRYGFALVVLTALAGRDWVRRVLLWTDDETGRRPADDREQVVDELRRHWPDSCDRHWDPLIQVLSEPFGAGGPIESAQWSAADWLARLLAAEQECVRRGPQRPVDLPTGPVFRYERDLEQVRREACAMPAPRPQLVLQACDALHRRAAAVGVRHAVLAGLAWAGGLAGTAVLLAAGAWGLGK